jgi:hypothetical protein
LFRNCRANTTWPVPRALQALDLQGRRVRPGAFLDGAAPFGDSAFAEHSVQAIRQDRKPVLPASGWPSQETG